MVQDQRLKFVFTLASALVQSEKSEASMIKIGGLVQAVATSLG